MDAGLARAGHLAGALLALGALAPSACARAEEGPGRWRAWSTLELKVRASLLLHGRVEMRLQADDGGTRIETSATASLFGATLARSKTVSVLDSAEGRTRSYETLSRKRGWRYVFGPDGYAVEKLEPHGESWDVTRREEFDYPARGDGAGPQPLLDYYAMLIRLRDTELHEPGDEVTLHVATSSGPRPYRIVVSESRTTERTFVDLATKRETTESVREFRLRVIPSDPSSDEGFLQMEGETEIWVEAGSKTPLEISGKVPRVPGRVHLTLAAIG